MRGEGWFGEPGLGIASPASPSAQSLLEHLGARSKQFACRERAPHTIHSSAAREGLFPPASDVMPGSCSLSMMDFVSWCLEALQ